MLQQERKQIGLNGMYRKNYQERSVGMFEDEEHLKKKRHKRETFVTGKVVSTLTIAKRNVLKSKW